MNRIPNNSNHDNPKQGELIEVFFDEPGLASPSVARYVEQKGKGYVVLGGGDVIVSFDKVRAWRPCSYAP